MGIGRISKALFILVLVVGTRVSWAATPSGTYYVLEVDGVAGYTGTMDISLEGERVGIVVGGLPLSAQPVESREVLTPRAETQIVEEPSAIVQHHTDGRGTIAIRYEDRSGFYVVTTRVCTDERDCDEHEYLVARSSSFGEAVAPESFLAQFEGEYRITRAGGAEPDPENSKAVVRAAQAYLMMPFCVEGGVCNPGYVFLKAANTRIHRRSEDDAVFYDIFVESAGAYRYYVWAVYSDGTTRFSNLQYKIEGETVCMEHELEKSSE